MVDEIAPAHIKEQIEAVQSGDYGFGLLPKMVLGGGIIAVILYIVRSRSRSQSKAMEGKSLA